MPSLCLGPCPVARQGFALLDNPAGLTELNARLASLLCAPMPTDAGAVLRYNQTDAEASSPLQTLLESGTQTTLLNDSAMYEIWLPCEQAYEAPPALVVALPRNIQGPERAFSLSERRCLPVPKDANASASTRLLL
eukprot:3740795-Pleurochrysis_carterae.AAC.1